MTTNKQESLLEQIHFPSDLRNLSADRLEDVCVELRRYIIDVLSKTCRLFAALFARDRSSRSAFRFVGSNSLSFCQY